MLSGTSEASRRLLEIDRGRFAVGGESAGGNLSAVMSHMARDGDLLPICFQMLLYPSVEMSICETKETKQIGGPLRYVL